MALVCTLLVAPSGLTTVEPLHRFLTSRTCISRRDALTAARTLTGVAAGASVQAVLPCSAEDSSAVAAAATEAGAALQETNHAPVIALPPAAPKGPTAFDFNVPFRGEPERIEPFLGKVSLLVNVKFDDPETTEQLPALQAFVETYSKQGLSVLAFPTDQV